MVFPAEKPREISGEREAKRLYMDCLLLTRIKKYDDAVVMGMEIGIDGLKECGIYNLSLKTRNLTLPGRFGNPRCCPSGIGQWGGFWAVRSI